ncbi:hypothetical protein COY95_03320, partial [Candidatus Woesearchaeota archaeon CG_4_10_14_0_8_um_filter_47_5]
QSRIKEVVLLQEADKKGFSASGQEVEEHIQEKMGQSNMTDEELQERLKDQNLTYNDIIMMNCEEIVLTNLVNDVVGSVKVSEDEIRAFYDENKEQIQQQSAGASYEDVRGEISDYLLNTKKNEYFLDYINALLANTTAVFYGDYASLQGKSLTEP